jgi:phospholipid transport system substrate-binding protein
MRHLFAAILCMFLLVSPGLADNSSEVRELLKVKIDAIVVLLQDQTTEKHDRNERILDIIAPMFDFQTMAKLSLGKKYWPTLSQEQQATFSDLFSKRLQRSYLEKLDLYTNEEVIYGEPEANGKQVHQPTTLISKDSRISMLYKLYLSSSEWRIYDVEIGGVSVIQTYRSQFDGVLSEGTINDLLEKLKTDGAFVISAHDEKEARPQ